MALCVFGPKTSGIQVGHIHVGLTTQVFQAQGAVPGCFTLVATSPLGQRTQLTVANGASTTLTIVPDELTAQITTDDWTPALPSAASMCSFKVVIRLNGHVNVPIVGQFPVSVQMDAFDVVLHSALTDAQAAQDAALQQPTLTH